MIRAIKVIFLLTVLAAFAQSAMAFSLLGPGPSFPNVPANFGDRWQVPALGYNPNPVGDTAPTGPKNVGEDFRVNTPIVYYTYDPTFLGFFGTNGVRAVDQAFAVFNSLTNVSTYSDGLSEFPLNSERVNYTAAALGLEDLKSTTMALVAEQMGLGQPSRYTWTLHHAGPDGSRQNCPLGRLYWVVQRNYDPTLSGFNQSPYSPYVNGVLFSYSIVELCAAVSPDVIVEQAAVFPVVTEPQSYTAVADWFPYDDLSPSVPGNTGTGFGGAFLTQLTRDDVGGLRYLLRTNNLHFEDAGPAATTFDVNTNPANSLIITSNLNLLLAQTATNAPNALLGIYPNLIISSTITNFNVAIQTNVTCYNTNGIALGSFRTVFVTNLIPIIVTNYDYRFANLVTNSFFTNGSYAVLTTNVTTPAGSPIGSPPLTNVVLKTIHAPMIMGDFYIVPINAGGVCGFVKGNSILTRVLAVTNVVGTNALFLLNCTNNLNTNNSTSIVTYFTNHVYIGHTLICTNDTPALRQGVERVHFVRRDYDSLLSQFFIPITNIYFLNSITNFAVQRQTIARIVTTPDLVLYASDLNPTEANVGNNAVAFNAGTRTINYDVARILPGEAGPGTILMTSNALTFTKVGSIIFQNQLFQSKFLWGSFDQTTNPPVIYPDGASLLNLVNSLYMHITTITLPIGQSGASYPPPSVLLQNSVAQFTGTGGVPPYTWSLSPQSIGGLPDGLFLQPDGTITDQAGDGPGTPTTPGVYDFTVRMTDSTGRFVEEDFTITIL